MRFGHRQLGWTTAAVAIGLGGALANAAPLTIFEDNFDSHTDGAQISTVSPPIGSAGNYVLAAGQASNNVVQSAVNNGGNALRATRTLATGPQWVNGFWENPDGIVEGGFIYTVKYDLYRANAESNTGAGIDVGYGPGDQNPYLLIGTGYDNSHIYYRNPTNGTWVDSGHDAGVGGWETHEIVVTFSPPDGNNMIFGTYDVYLTRTDPNNSEGLLARTKIVDGVAAYIPGFTNAVALGRFQYYVGAPGPDNGLDSIVYFDNVSVVRTEIPEPAGLAALSLGALALMRRRG